MTQYAFRCRSCGVLEAWTTSHFRCVCQELFDWTGPELLFDPESIDQNDPSLLRYRHLFPPMLIPHMEAITLGEGWTKTIPSGFHDTADASIESFGAGKNWWIKMDHLMPSFSFKDRGALFLVAMARAMNAHRIIQDSSGNAGHSVAVYAARANIPCEIYVPQGTSSAKIRSMAIHGATVCVIPGSREDTADAALKAAQQPGVFYASHVYNPIFYEGTATYAYELWEQFAGDLPSQIILPVGNGTLVLGVYYALLRLQRSGCLEKIPRIIGVQAEPCAPIANAFRSGASIVKHVTNRGTLADGIAIARPLRGTQVLEAIRATGGELIVASEELIPVYQKKMAASGLCVESTTAATFAAFAQWDAGRDSRAVLPICGAGMKEEGK